MLLSPIWMTLQRAQEALEKGARFLSERQKLIKIADCSTNGWSVVAEYTADELADDSEGEKRIEKAEKAAERGRGSRSARDHRSSPGRCQQPAQPATLLRTCTTHCLVCSSRPRQQQRPGHRQGSVAAPESMGHVYPMWV